MQALDLTIPSHQSELDLPQADDIRINDTGPVMRAAGQRDRTGADDLCLPSSAARRCTGFQLSSEGRHFANSNRCLIAAFFEFTGKKYPKAKHRFTLKGSPITAIAGLWKEAQGNHPPTFTMLTTAPVSRPAAHPQKNQSQSSAWPRHGGRLWAQVQWAICMPGQEKPPHEAGPSIAEEAPGRSMRILSRASSLVYGRTHRLRVRPETLSMIA
jgi:hypothetical protein